MTQARRWVAKDFGGPEVLEEIVVELPRPGTGEVMVEVRAAGMNPADYKHFGPGQDPKLLPLTTGYEVAGVILALGPDTEIASGGGAVGDEVVVFQIFDGYSSALNAPAADVFGKPSTLSFPEAANVLLVGTTAAETLHVIGLSAGETVLVHGAAGGVGTSVVQQAGLLDATWSEPRASATSTRCGGSARSPSATAPAWRIACARPRRVASTPPSIRSGSMRRSTLRSRSSQTAGGSFRRLRSRARRGTAFDCRRR